MAAMYKPQPNTGILYSADDGFGSTFQGDSLLPRSIASDGRRTVLIFHVLVHVLALAANIVSCVYMYEDFVQTQMQTGAIAAAAMHGVGVFCLLALAASEVKQIAFVVSLAFIYSFLLSGLLATAMMAIFTFRSDDVLTEPHWLYYSEPPTPLAANHNSTPTFSPTLASHRRVLLSFRSHHLPADARPRAADGVLPEHVGKRRRGGGRHAGGADGGGLSRRRRQTLCMREVVGEGSGQRGAGLACEECARVCACVCACVWKTR